jgi:spore germination protein KC
MINKKKILLVVISLLSFSITGGCWNYREIDKMAVVAGVAIDKGLNGQYLITVETIQIGGGNESEMKSQLFTINGKTIFDAVRNMISLSGKRLYWSHTKVVIVSKDVAREGILPILDWFHRDSETRADINILVSEENTAREILVGKNKNEIKSLKLEDMLKNEKSISKAPVIEIWKVINDIAAPGVVSVLPVVAVKGGKPKIMGTAILNNDKLTGFLGGEESKYLLFAKDQIKGGLLILGKNESKLPANISLEIFKSKTKVKPEIIGDKIKINLKIETKVAIDEVDGDANFADKKNMKKLKMNAENELNKRVMGVIKKVQTEYGVDIFGFGAKIHEENPKVWKKIEPTWQSKFKDLTVNVTSNIDIKGSAMLAEPLEMGD